MVLYIGLSHKILSIIEFNKRIERIQKIYIAIFSKPYRACTMENFRKPKKGMEFPQLFFYHIYFRNYTE
jgi:hypothetical protein